jgi:hypothetical protein
MLGECDGAERVLVRDGHASHCRMPRERNASDREQPHCHTAQRNATKGQPADCEETKGRAANTHAADGNGAARDQYANSDITDGDPTSGDAAAIDAADAFASRDVNERESEKLGTGSVFHHVISGDAPND